MRVPSGSDVPESHRDLLDAPFATLATVGPTGRPQMSTVCFLASEDGHVQLSVNATRQKSLNMVRNPMVALHILDADEHRTVVTVSLNRVRAVDMRKPGTVGSSLNR